jgi:hypothetical protein
MCADYIIFLGEIQQNLQGIFEAGDEHHNDASGTFTPLIH